MASAGRAFAWAALSLGVIGCAEFAVLRLEWSIRELHDRNQWAEHSQQVMGLTEQALFQIKDAESAERAYIITGDERYAQTVAEADTGLADEFRNLEQIVADNPKQVDRFIGMERLARTRLEDLDRRIALRRTKGFTASAAAFDDSPGQELMAEVEDRARASRAEEQKLLTDRSASAEVLRAESIRTGTFSVAVLAAWLLAALLVALEFGRAQRRLNHFLQSVSDGFFALDFQWRISHINRAAEEFYGVSAKDVMGRDLLDVFPKTRGSELERVYRSALEHGRPEVYSGQSPTTGKYVESRCFPTREGIVVFFHDITERFLQQRRIEELNATLERRVLERTAQLEGFCYSIAHDMRTHIRGVSINASMLKSDLHGEAPEVGQSLERLIAASKQMSRLVEDLLEHARSASLDVRTERVDMSEIAAEVAEMIRHSGQYPDADFTIMPGLTANADPQLIRVVLQNLFDNACKYSSRDRACCIEFGMNTGDGAGVFFVADNGTGFDSRFTDRMFMPFERLHSDYRIPGSGIGLANVKRIIERHQGRVWATSKPGEGATFYFTLGSPDSLTSPCSPDSTASLDSNAGSTSP